MVDSKFMGRVLIVIAVIAMVAFGWLFFTPVEWGWPHERFSSTAWATSPQAERYKMARDLVESKVLIGKSKEAVVAVLGKPDFVASDGAYQSYTLKNSETRGAILPGIAVLDVRFSDGVARELVIRSI
jgi:hypothetical protein